jgi:nitric oxide dioxygenase
MPCIECFQGLFSITQGNLVAKSNSTLTNKRGSQGMGLPDAMKPETVNMIAATAGVVAPKALDITKTFYGNVLKKHPGLLAYFNPAHNVPVSIHQPSALAASIVAYASNIKDLSPLLVPGGPVDAICHRHCALGIWPEQYVIVHDNLMAAVAEVLGPAVTPEIAAAWSEAVLFLAKVFIDKEESLYQMAEKRNGGWSGPMDFVVTEVKEVADGIKSFSFKPPVGSILAGKSFDFTPGQYLSLVVDPEGDGLMAPRHYTVTSPPGANFLQCTVKKNKWR